MEYLDAVVVAVGHDQRTLPDGAGGGSCSGGLGTARRRGGGGHGGRRYPLQRERGRPTHGQIGRPTHGQIGRRREHGGRLHMGDMAAANANPVQCKLADKVATGRE